MASKQTVELQYLTNAKMILGELRLVNAELHNIRNNTDKAAAAHGKGASGAKKHGSAMAGLALRFVGYNLVLNQVMGAQQKLVEFMKESVKAYREFETRLAEISTILGSDQIPLMIRLKGGIESLSVAYGQATSDMSKGMYDILSAAFDAESAISLLTTATKASIAGLSNIRTSVDIFTTVLNTYGMQVEQATNVSNILFQSVIRGKFQFQDLEQALGYIVPIASQAGIAFDELMGALSTATRHGLHLDMTSRGLAMAISGIVNPTEKTIKAAKKYGLEIGGLSLRVMGLHGWFKELNAATKEYGQSILGELIPNIRSLRVAMVLASDVGLAGFTNDLTELAEMGNATEKALEKIMNTSQFTSNQLTQQWEQVKRDVGEDWDELMLHIQRGLLSIVDIFNRGEYASTAGEEFEFIKDESIHNATEYMKILNEITKLEEERANLPPDPKSNIFRQWSPIHRVRRSFDEIVRSITGEKKVSTTPIDDINKDIAALITTQEKFLDSFNEIVGGIRDETDALGDLELTLNNIELSIREVEEQVINTFVYGFKDASGAMKEASVSIAELTTLTQEQRDALSGLGDTIKGNLAYQYLSLEAQRTYADATHDVSMGLKIANYAYKEIPSNVQSAVAAIREYTKAQDSNKKATQQLTAAMRVYQIQLLEIQLKGMMRRRGLTRTEEKQIKRIQIAQAKARLENMKGQSQMLQGDVATYQSSKTLIDEYVLKLQEQQYELKYTYDQQIADLETTISQEGKKLQTRYDWWETTNQKIINNSQDLLDTLDDIMDEPVFLDMLEEYGLKVSDLEERIASLMAVAEGRTSTYPAAKAAIDTSSATEVLAEKDAMEHDQDKFNFLIDSLSKIGKLPEYETGVSYVPETGPAIVHKGERITPAGVDVGGNVYQFDINIAATVSNDYDVIRLAAKMREAMQTKLVDADGKSKYRMR